MRLGAPIQPAEQVFHDLTTVIGDLLRDGLDGYFSRNYTVFDRHLNTLREHGFADFANELERARLLLFGEEPLTRDVVDESLESYLDADEAGEGNEVLEELLDGLWERCYAVGEYKDAFGMQQGFYERLD